MIKKPMLAAKIENMDKLKFPFLASPKLDGIRCLKVDGKALTRTFKPIPNTHIRNWIEENLPDGIDGEVVIMRDGVPATFNEVQSGVMKEAGEPDFKFFAFDLVSRPENISLGFETRYEHLKSYCSTSKIYLNGMGNLYLVPHIIINNMEELTAYEEKCLSEGYEGVMLRSLDGKYKCGRATEREGSLLKVKRFEDSEARITGFIEQTSNMNEATEDELGHTKRSTHQDNMVPNGHLGLFLAEEIGDTPWKGQTVKVGGAKGMTKEMRKEIWENREQYIGKIIKYSYQPHGIKDLPRLPIWLGFRDERDM